jgi:hypothetical protein
MTKMSQAVRKLIVDIAENHTFSVQLEQPSGDDLYEKNLVFRSPFFKSAVFICKVTGISQTTGAFSYLKVAVHPDDFKPELVNPVLGVEDYVNRQSKVNRHHNSNYREGSFPDGIPGKYEPYGKCYKVQNLDALEALFAGLAG